MTIEDAQRVFGKEHDLTNIQQGTIFFCNLHFLHCPHVVKELSLNVYFCHNDISIFMHIYVKVHKTVC